MCALEKILHAAIISPIMAALAGLSKTRLYGSSTIQSGSDFSLSSSGILG